MGVSLNGGTQQPLVFLLKMIILGCFGGTTISGNTHILIHACFLLVMFRFPGASNRDPKLHLYTGSGA